MNCPLCSTAAKDDAIECTSCGAFFAKLRPRAQKAEPAPAVPAAPPQADPLEEWKPRIAAAAVAAGLMLAIGAYFSRLEKIPETTAPRPRKPAITEPGDPKAVRDEPPPPGVPPRDPDFDE